MSEFFKGLQLSELCVKIDLERKNQESSNRLSRISEYVLYLVVAVIYAAGLSNDLGDDYGYYFVGSRSLDSDYRLYEAWFDNKGPLFFLLAKVLTSVLPYNLFGAKVFLAIIFFSWCVACSYCGKQFGILGSRRVLFSFVAIASLSGMSTNSVVGVLLATLLLIFYVNFYHFLVVKSFHALWMSATTLALANLTRPDSFPLLLFSLLTLLFVGHMKLQLATRFFLAYLLVFALFYFLSARVLYLDFDNFFYNNFTFNMIVYPTYELGGLPQEFSFNSLYRPQAMRYFIATGTGMIVIVYLIHLMMRKSLRHHQWYILGILTAGLSLFLASNSDKDYYSLIFAPSIVCSLAMILCSVKMPKILLSMSVVVAIGSSLLWLYERSTPVNCLLNEKNCVSVQKVERLFSWENRLSLNSVSYYLGTAWPYLFRNEKPEIDFSPTVPLDLDLGSKSLVVRSEILNSKVEGLWIAPRFRQAFGSESDFSLKSGRKRVLLPSILEKSFEGGLELWIPKKQKTS
jgi:hypothetical protein